MGSRLSRDSPSGALLSYGIMTTDHPFDFWRTISLAPTDGTRILLFRPIHALVEFGCYDDDRHAIKPKPYWSTPHSYLGVREQRENAPTHWMPSPPLPVSGGEGSWQSIASAPTDGTSLLLFRPRRRWVEIGLFNNDRHAIRPKPYWASARTFGGVREQRSDPPSHWMPMPPPACPMSKQP